MPTNEPSIPWKRRAAFLAVPYAVFLIVLLGVEALVRATAAPIRSLELFVTAAPQQAQFVDRQDVRIVEGDPLLFWRLIPGLRDVMWDLTLVTTNARGIRYPAPLGPKPKGTFRIVCLGDSVTFGYRVPLVFPSKPRDYDPRWLSYPALLERRLREAAPALAIEVIPLAVPGYSSHQGLAWLRRDIAWLRPDVVTACFGWNDIGRRGETDSEAMGTNPLEVAARGVVSHSQALSHAVTWLRTHRGVAGVREGLTPLPIPPDRYVANSLARAGLMPMRVPRESYVANMLEIARVGRSAGAAAVLIGPVYRDRVSHPPEGDQIGGHRDALRDAARTARIPYLEIPELTEGHHPGNAHLFGEHIHPNHRGHKLMAERLQRFLAERRLIPEAARGAAVEAGPP